MDDLIILDKRLESVLRGFQQESHGADFGITEKACSHEEFAELKKAGYVEAIDTSSYARWSYIAKLTYKGIHYFELKKQYKRKQRQPKIFEWVRYGITTLIALAALAVSIIALFTKAQ